MRTAYFSLDRIPERSDCEKLLREYKLGKTLGKGAYGKVYELCKEDNCNYILKTIEFNKTMYDEIGAPKMERNYMFKGWKKEIDNQLTVIECQKKYKYKFVPDIYDAWYCDHDNGNTSFYIIMERFEGDLKDFIKRFSKNELLKTVIEAKFNMLHDALEHINKTCGICLDDIKLENILYKKNKQGTYDLVFSDFGTSFYGKDVSSRCIETDIRRFNQAINEFIEKF